MAKFNSKLKEDPGKMFYLGLETWIKFGNNEENIVGLNSLGNKSEKKGKNFSFPFTFINF